MADVSEGTVDRIIHNRGQVSQANIDKVNAIINEYGYKKNIFASNLAFNKKFTFAVLLPKSDGIEFWKMPLEGIKRAEKDYSNFGVLIDYYFYDYNAKSFSNEANKLLVKNYDGLLFAPVFFNESELFLDKCKSKKLKTVLIDSTIYDNNEIAFTGQNASQSGLIAGKLSSLNFNRGNTILIIKITREIETTSVYLQRIKGFYSFFKDKEKFSNVILKEIDIKDSEKDKLNLEMFENVSSVFIPNSRSYIVAGFLKTNAMEAINVVGYDLLDKNISYLKEGYIDFLMNQKPDQQGFLGIEYLYKTIVLKEKVETLQNVPVEIVIKESFL